jgi:LPXTG-site transpeptidase (sortase) family protein
MIRQLLPMLERWLIGTGVLLGLWCAGVYLEARYTDSLPPSPMSTLPGDVYPGRTHMRPGPAKGSWVARLRAPSVNLSTVVLEGSDDGILRRAAGHIEDTALPGEVGNLAIAGHRDTTFRRVRDLRRGDPLIVSTPGRIYRYRVTRTIIVKPEDIYVLDPTERRTLTLVTCYPFDFIGHAPERFIVRAEFVRDGKE